VAFSILGPLAIEVDGRAVDAGPPKQRAVLALLVLRANHVVAVDRVIDQLWGDEPPARALGSLQAYISNLRRVLEPHRLPRDVPRLLATQSPGYVLRARADAIDAERFERLAVEGREHLRTGRLDLAGEILKEALDLWRGDVLVEFEREPFCLADRARLDELRAVAREDAAEVALARGNHFAAVADLEGLCADAPFRERRWELLMLALYRGGRQADALRAYQTARRTLREELGVDPGLRLRELEAAILSHDANLDWRPSPAPAHPAAAIKTVEAIPSVSAPRPRLFVGRESAFAALATATDNGAGVVLVAGEAGIGKTRLVEQFADHLQRNGVRVCWGRCTENEGAPPLWPWRDLLAQFDTVPDGVAFAVGATNPAAKDASVGRSAFELNHDVADFIIGTTRRTPTLVVLEDLHWADPSSLDLLCALGETMRPGDLVLIGTYRDAELSPTMTATFAALARQPGHHRITLQGLDVAAVAEFASETAGVTISRAVADRLRERTDGNPFFLAEILKLLASEHRLDLDDESVQLPVAVTDVIHARLDRLPPDARTLLTIGAVCGRSFDLTVICEATGTDADTALDHIDTALATGFITEPEGAPGQYVFCHALMREALYHDLSALRRARLHLRVAEAIQRRAGTDADEHVAELAYHFARAAIVGGADRALEYCCRAAERATARSAHAAAASHWRDALTLLDASAPDDWRRRYEILVALGSAERLGAQSDSSREHFHSAALLAETHHDAVAAAHAAVAGGSATVWNWTGYKVDAAYIALLERLDRALAMTEPRLRTLVLANLATEHAAGAGSEIGPVARKALDLAASLDDPEARFAALNASFVALQGTPEVQRRIEFADAMVAEADATLRPDASVTAYLCRFLARLQTGDGHAVDDLDQAERRVRASHQPAIESFVEWNRSLLALLRGPLDAAEVMIASTADRSALRYRVDAWSAEPFLVQRVVLQYLRGQLAEFAPLIPALLQSPNPGMREIAVLVLVETGQFDDARNALRADVGRERTLPALPHDFTYALTLCTRAESIARTGESEFVADCRAELEPFAGQLGVVTASASLGAVDYYLGRLAESVGDVQGAIRHFGDAVAVNERACANVFVPWSRARLGIALVAAGDAAGEASFEFATDEARHLGVHAIDRTA
jgi:DNA-binding SARP family transcriptional activator